MAELNAAVLKNFGLTVHKTKKEKAYYICETPDGFKKISKTSDTADQLMFQHTIKEHVWSKGYQWVDRFALSVSGLPFVTAGGDYFVMTPLVRGRETDFENWMDVKQALESVARFHIYARHVPLDETPSPDNTLEVFFQKQLASLNAVAKKIRRQARLSDFDVLFIKNIHFYAEQIKNTIEIIKGTDYPAWWHRALSNRYICHNALKEESLMLDRDQTYITHFNDAAVDVQLNDLAAFIRRYAQRSGSQAVPVRQLLDIYNRIEPLPLSGITILYALLQFPWNFMKIVNQYYSKKRSWTPNAMANRMHTVVSEKEQYARYIFDLEREL